MSFEVIVAIGQRREPIEQKRKITLSAFSPSNSSDSDSDFTFPLDTDIDLDSVPPDLKAEGKGWCALYSPRVKRVLDVHAVHTLKHDSIVHCARFSRNGKHLVTCCDHTTQIFDVKTGDKICTLSDDPSMELVRSACFSPDGKLLATTPMPSKLIRIWDISKKCIQDTFEGHDDEVMSVCFTPDGRFLVSGSMDKSLRIWDMHDGSSRALFIDTNCSEVGSLAISPDGSFIAAGCLDSIRIWEVNTGRLVEQLNGHEVHVFTVAFTPDGKGLISGGVDGTVNRWDVSALGNHSSISDPSKSPIEPTFTIDGHRDIVYSVVVSPDGQWIVSGSRDRTVQIWDASNGVVHCMIDGHWDSIGSVDLSPDGEYLVSAGGNSQAKIWRLERWIKGKNVLGVRIPFSRP